ncbi:c-type cytochrome biogenesis protein CcsB [Streptomyces sp. NPDC059853]|uniref:c-type cytochrome biogenesis protein CcsB n=1 Tax=Streptomyces sp. NPDC059853 TaxID=3346973 RepID=UPI0036526914
MNLAMSEELADLSNYLIYSAMAVYTLAFVAHIAEWLFGSRSKVARTAAALTADDRAVPAQRGADTISVTVRGKGGTDVLERPAVVTRSASPQRDAVPDGPGAAAGDEKGDLYGRIALSLTVLAFLMHLAAVVVRTVAVERAPWANMYEFSTSFSMTVVAAYLLFLLAKKNVAWLGLPLVATVLLDLGLAVAVLYTDSTQLVPALDSVWLIIHVALAIGCGALMYVAVVATVLFLFRDSYENKLASGGTPGKLATSVLERLPSSVSLDKFSYRITAAVFPVWTFTIIAGAIWAENAWGRYWGWDPKEVWAFITWVAYAAYLHARATAGWKGRRAAYLGIAGFVCYLINYYGVNMFVNSLHSYSGL